MGLVYVYVVAWVLGGVVLGARLLLAHREPEALSVAAAGLAPGPEEPRAEKSRAQHRASLGAVGLVTFGLFGLLAEGLGVADTPWLTAAALAAAALLTGAAHLLTRAR